MTKIFDVRRELHLCDGAISILILASLLSFAQAKPEPHAVVNEKDGAEMVLIPAGSFLMGTIAGEVDADFRETGLPEDWKEHTQDEQPRHRQTLKSYYLYKYEVTNAQYQAFTDATGHRTPPHWKGKDHPAGKANHPVVEVSWDDAHAYCQWAGTRLPTEAEWEYAARGPGAAPDKPSLAFPWGNNWDRTICNNSSFHAGKEIQNADDWGAWYNGDQSPNFPLTSEGGAFPKSVSPFGIHDMAGNAWEWCAEIQAPYPERKAADAEDKTKRARRGGSWANVALHIRAADRQGAAQDDLNIYTGFRCVKRGTGKVSSDGATGFIEVEQAGDQFVNFVLEEIEKTRQELPDIAAIADRAAEQIVNHDGEFLSAGDRGFALEPVWRAGGIAFARQFLPVKPVAETVPGGDSAEEEIPYYRTKQFLDHFTLQQARPQDVVVLGYENEQEEKEQLGTYAQELIDAGALVVFFGSTGSAQELIGKFGKHDNLVVITHDVPDGGLLQIPGWSEKICSGRSIANRLRLWTFQAELISGFMRRGKMPGILLSVTYESPQIWNTPLLHDYKFIPAFNVEPVEEQRLGNTYLDHLQRIVSGIVPPQREEFRQTARWLADSVGDGRKPYVLLIHGVNPDGLRGDPGLFTVYSEGNAYYPEFEQRVRKDDVALFVGYNWYPPRLADAVDRVGGKQVLCFTLVDELPPKPAVYGEVGELLHPISFDELPQADNRIYIDLNFAQYNAVLQIPGYPVPALESSSFAEDVVYWHLVADTVELLSQTP